MTDRKTLIELALKAGRKRQSKQTGFVHYCYESHDPFEHDTIPLYENFCFALALFRSRMSDNVLEGKSLLEKLFKFRVQGNFPIYLHEYPVCRNPGLGPRILTVLQKLVEEFHNVLGAELKAEIEKVESEIEERLPLARPPATPEEWGDALAYAAVNLDDALAVWHPSLHAYIGPSGGQERGEPALTLLDLYMCQLFGSFSKRALADHPVHLRAALLYPPEYPKPFETMSCCYAGTTLLWGGPDQLHSFFCAPKKSALKHEGNAYVFTLPEVIPEEGDDRLECGFYCNIHEDTTLFVNDERATTFQIGDKVEIRSKGVIIALEFMVKEGEGKFFGQIARGNRPGQRSAKGEYQFAAYDWQIALRTISRTANCTVEVKSTLTLN